MSEMWVLRALYLTEYIWFI